MNFLKFACSSKVSDLPNDSQFHKIPELNQSQVKHFFENRMPHADRLAQPDDRKQPQKAGSSQKAIADFVYCWDISKHRSNYLFENNNKL